MLPPEESPLQILIARYRAMDPTSPQVRRENTHAACRAEVWMAASLEQDLLAENKTPYNPSDDCRVKWLLEWCDTLEGSRRAIEDRLTSSVEFLGGFRPPALSGRDRAAGSHLEQDHEDEPRTLAQGS